MNREVRTDDAETVVPENAPERGDRLDDDAAPAIDWDAERRRAVAMVLERREREKGYATFSLDDVVEEEPPARFAQGPSVFILPRTVVAVRCFSPGPVEPPSAGG